MGIDMAGFFGLFDYNKPGKGVAKDEPKKPAPIHFLQLVVRKFFKLITLNLLYFVVLLPLIAVFLLYLFNIMQIKPEEIVSPLLTLIVMAAGSLPNIVNYLLLIVSAVLFGPATAAVSYILRNYAREEHAWLWYDFKTKAKENFRQAFCVGVIDLVVCASFLFYLSSAAQGVEGPFQVLSYLAFPIIFVYIIMRFYIYTVIVTFNISLFNAFKNSLIFFVLGLGRNLIALIGSAAILFLCRFLDIVLVPLFAFTFSGFLISFCTWPVIKKYMIDKVQLQNNDTSTEDAQDETAALVEGDPDENRSDD